MLTLQHGLFLVLAITYCDIFFGRENNPCFNLLSCQLPDRLPVLLPNRLPILPLIKLKSSSPVYGRKTTLMAASS